MDSNHRPHDHESCSRRVKGGARLAHGESPSQGSAGTSFKKTVGIRRLKGLHVNDALTPLASNRDSHAIPGEGEIGKKGCAAFCQSRASRRSQPSSRAPGTTGHAPDKVDVDTMKKLRRRGLAARVNGSGAAGSRPLGR